MSTYVISDIHGHYNEFLKMLDLISFSDKDKLYILGDIIDRGPCSIEMIKYVMDKENIIMLMGNHEHMMLDYLNGCYEYDSSTWYSNGGYKTYDEFLYLSIEETQAISNWLANLPSMLEIIVNHQKYVLSHACPFSEFLDERIWSRLDPYSHKCIFDEHAQENVVYIIGHTPLTHYIKNEPVKILKAYNERLWYIDGGAAHLNNQNARLCYIRLDDLKEFYLPFEW